MTAVDQRGHLLSQIADARARVLEAISGLTEEQLTRPGIDGWSVKDHLNHLAACDETRSMEIRRISRGGRSAFPDINQEQFDALNAVIVKQRSSLPLDQVMVDLDAARELVIEAIVHADDRALYAEAYGNYAIDGSIEHDTEHAAAVAEWRKREGI